MTLLEKEDTCGGHTLTDHTSPYPVDLGFQVRFGWQAIINQPIALAVLLSGGGGQPLLGRVRVPDRPPAAAAVVAHRRMDRVAKGSANLGDLLLLVARIQPRLSHRRSLSA